MTRHHLIATFSALALITTAGLLTAGPINPPAGPIAPTAKPLSEIEPRTAINAANTPGDATSLFKITQPGSYYLTGNITGVLGKHGIAIAASGVTLDLNGFDLVGVPAMGAFDGVSVTVANLSSIAVVNGSVRSWGGEGVDLGSNGLSATNCRVEGVLASGNSGTGISAGVGSTVTNCSVYLNTGNGINVTTGSTVADCTTRANTLDGILCSSQCTIRGNTCLFSGNGAGDGAGIRATGTRNRIEGNNCTFADRGIEVGFLGNIIIKNTCAGNTTDWVIVANNVVGPILDRRAPASAAISGFSFVGSLGSTDSNANFSY